MRNCIIFCAGIHGSCAFGKISKLYNVIAYSDNNEELWGCELNGVPVLPPADIVSLSKQGAVILVCNMYSSKEIAAQLSQLGAENIYCIPCGILYEYASGAMLPSHVCSNPTYYKKSRGDVFSILYVQTWPCQRTNKIASVVKRDNVEVHIAYTLAPPKNEWKIYDGEHEFWDLTELKDFVENSEFDVVHSSNEPDCFTTLLIQTGKRIIHDTHDMTSLLNIEIDGLISEYIANTYSKGNLYTTPEMGDIAVRKYLIPVDKTLVVENLPLVSNIPKTRLEKLSQFDSELHCVYEGTISPNDCDLYRFEMVWLKIANAGVHVHFYSTTDSAICEKLADKSPYLHYEGSVSLKTLLIEMTKYDCGLFVYDVKEKDRLLLNSASPNKFCEYLASGLPLAVGGIERFNGFVAKYNCGGHLDLDGDIKEQLHIIATIEIPDNFLQINGLTMDSKADEILAFYKKIARADA